MNLLYKIIAKIIKPLVGSGIGNIHWLYSIYQKIMPKVLPESEQVIDVQGFKVKVLMEKHMNDIATELMFKGIHEPATTRVFKKLLKLGDAVVDIGANIGYFTIMSAQLVGWRGKVYAFEPDPTNMKMLYENIRLNKLDNVETYMLALTNNNGTATLHLSSREPARHSLIKSKEHDHSEGVLTAKLDDILTMKKPNVRLLKTDTEGNELAVLHGAYNTINSSNKIVLIVEINFEALEACNVKIEWLLNYIVVELGMKYLYLVDDYNDKIEFFFSRESYFDIQVIKPRGKAVLGYNLVCSREELSL